MIAARVLLAISTAVWLGSCGDNRTASQSEPAKGEPVKNEPTQSDLAITALINTAEEANKQNRFEGTILSLAPVLREGGDQHDLYAGLSDGMRYRVDKAFGWAALRLGMTEEAHQTFIHASESPLANEETWFLRYQSAKADGDFEDVYTAIKTWSERWPKPIFGFRDRDVSETERGLGTIANGAEAQLLFEQYLDRSGWEPQDPFFTKAVIRFHQAEHLYEIGKKDEAYNIAGGIEDTYGLTLLLTDKRFDALVSQNPEKFDLRAAGEKKVQRAREEIGKRPEWLEARNTLVSWLMELGREDEALKEVNDALTMAAQLVKVAHRYDPSFAGTYATTRVLKTLLLFDLGRFDEALRAGEHIQECGPCGPSLTQVLVMGELLMRLGRGSEALEWLMPVANEKLDIARKTQLAYLLSCTAFQARKSGVAEENLHFLKGHGNYGSVLLVSAFLCANDANGAAEATKNALDDPFQRPILLQQLQQYIAPKRLAPFDKQMAARQQRLLARTDVAAAVDRVGHINKYPLMNVGPMY